MKNFFILEAWKTCKNNTDILKVDLIETIELEFLMI